LGRPEPAAAAARRPGRGSCAAASARARGARGGRHPAEARPADEGANVTYVTSPFVGTFYRSPSPGAEPFVKIGDVVEPGQTLAVIEAMKLLNNITAEVRAKVLAVHVDNGDVVEFAQPLLDLEPVD